jgi:hypothetical protein
VAGRGIICKWQWFAIQGDIKEIEGPITGKGDRQDIVWRNQIQGNGTANPIIIEQLQVKWVHLYPQPLQKLDQLISVVLEIVEVQTSIPSKILVGIGYRSC